MDGGRVGAGREVRQEAAGISGVGGALEKGNNVAEKRPGTGREGQAVARKKEAGGGVGKEARGGVGKEAGGGAGLGILPAPQYDRGYSCSDGGQASGAGSVHRSAAAPSTSALAVPLQPRLW